MGKRTCQYIVKAFKYQNNLPACFAYALQFYRYIRHLRKSWMRELLSSALLPGCLSSWEGPHPMIWSWVCRASFSPIFQVIVANSWYLDWMSLVPTWYLIIFKVSKFVFRLKKLKIKPPKPAKHFYNQIITWWNYCIME